VLIRVLFDGRSLVFEVSFEIRNNAQRLLSRAHHGSLAHCDWSDMRKLGGMGMRHPMCEVLARVVVKQVFPVLTLPSGVKDRFTAVECR